ncbi:uncharacterized protein PSFLO_07604 [Pseudozyma flocculosa]|uniref:YDG domain-containing protein n=1 Tax=Pseudozyma flocculosa TaxID=84751 RepID=A0A5C3FF67_9BASI|nr:uncharacterized protein PSFLO_07604 [Pseudozyma flocculosa]
MVQDDAKAALEVEYERQREDNIRANIELMKSLGLYHDDVALAKKPASASSPSKRKRDGPDEPFTPLSSNAALRTRLTRSASRNSVTATTSESFSSPSSSAKLTPRSALRRSTRVRSSTPSAIPRTLRRHSLPLSSFIMGDDDDEDDHRQRKADKLGRRIHSPKRFGHIPGIKIGTVWEKRMHCSTDAVHAPTVAGISGNPEVGCWSVCLSGGYEDDFDSGHYFQYTGSGGRDLKGTKENPKNLRTAPQSKDQSWTDNTYNAALYKSSQTGKPIRVIRGYKANNRYAPDAGYVYSGLYVCEKAWMTTGRAGFKVCKFAFRRLKDQDPLPVFSRDLMQPEPKPKPKPDSSSVASSARSSASATTTSASSESTPTSAARQTRSAASKAASVKAKHRRARRMSGG